MPPILSQAYTSVNGGTWQIVCADPSLGNQGVIVASRNDLPPNIRNSTDVAAIDTFINNFLDQALQFTDGNGDVRARFYARVHVMSNTGGTLVATGISSDLPIAADWWSGNV